jgi:hypothetical protein
MVDHLEAVAECATIDEIIDRLEAREIIFRTDPDVRPGMLKGATVSRGELEQLRMIDDVVRLGRVQRIDLSEIVLDHGTVPTSPDHLHVHCAAPGLGGNPPKAIFEEDAITLQPITRVNLSLSTGLTGFVEASDRTTAEKNRLCRPNAWADTPFDWLHHLLTGVRTELEWMDAPDVLAWIEASRLNIVKDIGQGPPSEELQTRFLMALGPAFEKLDTFTEQASDRERARIFDPGS